MQERGDTAGEDSVLRPPAARARAVPSVVSICTGEVLPPQGMAVSSGTAPTEADQEEEPGRSLQIKAWEIPADQGWVGWGFEKRWCPCPWQVIGN